MQLKLKSNFHDYYDPWFDMTGPIFERNSLGGMSRQEMFTYLRSVALTTPLHGTVSNIYEQLDDMSKNLLRTLTDVVVYTDLHAHQGEGKIRVSLEEALEQYPNHFASLYIPSGPSQYGTSLRYLQIGDRSFWLRYSSASDWRSNCGEVTIELLSIENPRSHPRIHHPLFAVDFIMADRLYAVDFNTAPGVRGTGVEDILRGSEVVEAIKRHIATTS